jgi:ribonuclease HI
MELLAVIKGLEAIKWQNAEVHVVSDSSYVVNAINKGWLENWKRKGYAKVKNPDLWMRLVPLLDRHRVSFHWIKGHAGHPENERCDALAVAAGAGAVAAGVALPPDAGYCPEEASLL